MSDFSARGGWWLVGQALLSAALVASWWLTGSDWSTATTIAGWLLVGGGVAVAVAGLVALGSNLSVFPSPVGGARLVDRSVFRFVRHPVYSGLVAGSVGGSLVDGNLVGLVVAVVLAGLLAGKSAAEEVRLAAAVDGYSDYLERVRWRMIPGIL